MFIWGADLRNKNICFNCDNESVVHILNSVTLKSVRVMALVRLLMMKCLQLNVMLRATHVLRHATQFVTPYLDSSSADSENLLQRLIQTHARYPAFYGMYSVSSRQPFTTFYSGQCKLNVQHGRNTFTNFCLHYGLNLVWPAPDQHMILFIAFNFEQGLSPNTIKTYVAGLNFYHKLHGFAAISNTFLIQKLLEDCYRSRQTKDDRRPITRSVLLVVVNVLSKVCYNAYETKLFQALFKIAYFGLFRVSELVGTSVTSFSRQIQVQDVAVLPDLSAVTICMFRFKTNQRGSPVTLRIPKEGDSQLCPVRELQSFLLVRYCQPGPLFCHANGRPVTLQQFTAILKNVSNSPHLITNFIKAIASG